MSSHARQFAFAFAFALTLTSLSTAETSHAFTHVVQTGESLAALSARIYGDPKLEALIAAANGLDAEGGVAPVPGMRLEIPAPTYRRVAHGETWHTLAALTLGAPARSDVLARANRAVPWVPPDKGEEILVPYVLTVVATEADRLDTIAKRFWGDPTRAWELDNYNARKPAPLKRGEVLLVPLPSLALTEQGKSEAKAAAVTSQTEGEGTTFEIQKRADAEAAEVPALLRSGKYVEVVTKASRSIGSNVLAARHEAPLQRALVEALVALGSTEEAGRACLRWRSIDPGARLDPVRTSPKVRAACAMR